jgi:hypothetical protein
MRAISMAMRIRRYGAERITQYGRSMSMATLDATGHRHWVEALDVLHRAMAMHPASPHGDQNCQQFTWILHCHQLFVCTQPKVKTMLWSP